MRLRRGVLTRPDCSHAPAAPHGSPPGARARGYHGQVGRTALLACLLAASPAPAAPGGSAMPLAITSTAFQQGGELPATHTCEGKDTSPPRAFSGVPAGAKSLALVVDDPDAPDPKAPRMSWVHWVLHDLPPSTAG